MILSSTTISIPRLAPITIRAAMSSSTATPLIKSSRSSPHVGCITLNNPSSLNALNLPMIRSLASIVQKWGADPALKCTILKGAPSKKGKPTFCAGGDVKSLYECAMKLEEGATHGVGARGLFTADFFREEYQLNYDIATQAKPQVSIWDGVVMGGGVGVSIHGQYRVCTENTMFSMPETALGLFPDVGATYWMPRLKGGLGVYLGLTGARLKADDLIYSGIATHFVKNEDLGKLEDRIFLSKDEDIEDILRDVQGELNANDSFLARNRKEIDVSFQDKDTVEDIIEMLRKLDTEFGVKTAELLMKMSPTSLKVTLQGLRRGGELDIEDCLKMEYKMAQKFMREGSDFYEGVRAVLVDKDHLPKWNPKSLKDITDDMVGEFFSSLGENEWKVEQAANNVKSAKL